VEAIEAMEAIEAIIFVRIIISSTFNFDLSTKFQPNARVLPAAGP